MTQQVPADAGEGLGVGLGLNDGVNALKSDCNDDR
jgi:hypothetical protein